MDFELVTSTDADNPIAHDLRLVGGQLNFIGGDITDVESYTKMVAQRVKCRLQMVRGEWFLDQKKGTPWREYIWGKAGVKTGGEAKIKQVFRNVIVNTPGVLRVDSLTILIDAATRKLNVEGEFTTDMKTQVTLTGLDEPFIVRV